MSGGFRDAKCRQAAGRYALTISSGSKQKLHRLDFPHRSRGVQRRDAALVGSIDIGSGVEQDLNRLRMTINGGHQSRDALAGAGVNIYAGFDQQLCDVRVSRTTATINGESTRATALASAPPASSALTASKCPPKMAASNAEFPPASRASRSAPFSSSIGITSAYPAAAAATSSGRPCSSRAFCVCTMFQQDPELPPAMHQSLPRVRPARSCFGRSLPPRQPAARR